MLERVETLSIFTFEGFQGHCILFLNSVYNFMLTSMWWSDVRRMIEADLDANRIKRPSNGSWYSSIAQNVFPEIGWYIDGKTRTSPINKARENRYTKVNCRPVDAQ
jgi:hypothetical protein